MALDQHQRCDVDHHLDQDLAATCQQKQRTILMSDETPTTVISGYKTTEFWFSSIAALLGILFASGAVAEGGSIEKVMGLAATVLAGLGYSVSRGLSKKAS